MCPKAGRKVQEGVVEGVPSLDPRPRLARPKLHFFSMSGFSTKVSTIRKLVPKRGLVNLLFLLSWKTSAKKLILYFS